MLKTNEIKLSHEQHWRGIYPSITSKDLKHQIEITVTDHQQPHKHLNTKIDTQIFDPRPGQCRETKFSILSRIRILVVSLLPQRKYFSHFGIRAKYVILLSQVTWDLSVIMVSLSLYYQCTAEHRPPVLWAISPGPRFVIHLLPATYRWSSLHLAEKLNDDETTRGLHSRTRLPIVTSACLFYVLCRYPMLIFSFWETLSIALFHNSLSDFKLVDQLCRESLRLGSTYTCVYTVTGQVNLLTSN